MGVGFRVVMRESSEGAQSPRSETRRTGSEFTSFSRGAPSGTGLHGASSLLARIQTWIQNHAVDHILIPGILLLARLLFFFLSSVGMYSLLYLYLMPRALVKEPIYFDYGSSPPTATLNLYSAHKQWEYVSGGLNAGTATDDTTAASSQFLRSDFAYSVDIGFTLAKSRRNYEIGKFMATVSLVDNTGDLIAKSSRPVVMPYQSSVTLFLDSISKYPCRIIGICDQNEVVSVHVPMMTEYREPKTHATESLDLTLSSDKADIGAVEVTIMPVLRGVVYFMWYYPILTAIICVSCLMGTHLGLYGAYVLITLAFKYLSEMGDNNEDIPGARSTDGGTESGSIIETEDTFATQSSQRADTAPSSTQNSRAVSSASFEDNEDSDGATSDVSSSIVGGGRSDREIEAVLISESSNPNDNPNLRRRLVGRLENLDGEDSGIE